MDPQDEEAIQRRKGEWRLAIAAIGDLAEEAIDNINEGQYELALTALDLIRRGILPVRNAIGQWVNRVVCPNCGLEGPNLVANRSGESPGTPDWPGPHHVVDIGFKCAHCRKEWGFEVLKDAQAT